MIAVFQLVPQNVAWRKVQMQDAGFVQLRSIAREGSNNFLMLLGIGIAELIEAMSVLAISTHKIGLAQ